MSRRRPPSNWRDLGPVVRGTRRRPAPGPNRRLLLAISLVVLIVVGGAGALSTRLHHNGGTTIADTRAPAGAAVIFIVDGLTPGMVGAGTPALSKYGRAGVIYSRAWLGQAEGLPLASAATIATGGVPRSTGIIGTVFADGTGKVARPAAPGAATVGLVDALMQTGARTPVASVLKEKRRSATILSVGGSDCAVANAAGSWLADYVLCYVRHHNLWTASAVAGHALPTGSIRAKSLAHPVTPSTFFSGAVEGWALGAQDRSVTQYALAAMRATHPALTIVHFPELAQVLPYVPAGRKARVERTLLAGIDDGVRSITAFVSQSRWAKRPVFLLTAGSEVAPITNGIPRIDFANAVTAAGGEQLYLYADGAAFIGLRDPLQSAPVAQVLESEKVAGVDGIFYRLQNGSNWSYSAQFTDPRLSPDYIRTTEYLLNTMASASAPDVVVVEAPGSGTRGTSLGSYVRHAVPAGFGWAAEHIPLIIWGHGVAAGRQSRYPARLVDVAPTVEALLGLKRPTSDGIVLADALLTPPSSTRSRQHDLSVVQGSYVDALVGRETAP